MKINEIITPTKTQINETVYNTSDLEQIVEAHELDEWTMVDGDSYLAGLAAGKNPWE